MTQPTQQPAYTMITRTYLVPRHAMNSFIAVTAAHQRQAAKAGLPIPNMREDGLVTGDDETQYHRMILTVRADAPGGYQFVGIIEHHLDFDDLLSNNYKNKVRPMPGCRAAMPPDSATTAPHCDHCGYTRRRDLTYVVMHPNGSTVRVGSTCLDDVLGQKNAAAFVTWLINLDEFLDAAAKSKPKDVAEEPQRRQRREDWLPGKFLLTTLTYIAQVNACVRQHGWVGTGVKGETRPPTWEHATAITPTGEDIVAAQRMISWARLKLVPQTDFQAAVRAAVMDEQFDARQRSLAAALVVLANQSEASFPPWNNARPPTQGGKYVVTGVLVERMIAGDPDPSVWHVLVTGDGQRVAWANRSSVLEVGQTYTVTGEYKEVHKLPEGDMLVMRRVKIETRTAVRSLPALRRYLAESASMDVDGDAEAGAVA